MFIGRPTSSASVNETSLFAASGYRGLASRCVQVVAIYIHAEWLIT